MKTNRITFAGIALLSLASLQAVAGPVSATPGIIKGVIQFITPDGFVPTTIEVDAEDTSHVYHATGTAVQNDPINCAAGSQFWCYSVTVESALANAYYLRPIAKTLFPVPFSVLAPFSPTTPAVSITSGATVTKNIMYQPGEISGTVRANDMNGNPLTLSSLELFLFDTTDNQNIFQEGCGGSAAFCPFNSVFQGGAPSTSPSYQVYLQPTESYSFLGRTLFIPETMVGGQSTPSGQSMFTWDPGVLFPSPGTVPGGQNLTQNYTFNQAADVTGNITLALPVYNLTTIVSGQTTAPGSFTDNYTATMGPTPGKTYSAYLNRIFDDADFTKQFFLNPQFILSVDQLTQLDYPPIPFTASPGQHVVLNFNDTPSSIAGRVTFDPPYPAGNYYPGIQAEALAPTGYGAAQTSLTSDAQGGTFLMPVFAGNWNYWRFGWTFDLGNPNFTSWYQVGQFLNISVPVASGQAITGQTFTIPTAKVKVYFTAPANTTFTDPQVSAVSGSFNGGVFTPDFADTANGEGLNQNMVTLGEADIVLRVDPSQPNRGFRLIPSAVINIGNTPGNGRTDFSPLFLDPKQGDVIIVGVPGTLSLTVDNPVNGQVFTTCSIPVSGTATGTTNISITVNGQTATVVSAGNPNDPNEVTFTTTIPCTGPNTTITVVASAPNNTPVTDVIQVTVTQLAATISVTPYSVTYDGHPHTATGAATGAGGVNLSADLDLSHTIHTNAGVYSADYWSFTDPNGVYTSTGPTTITDTISPAPAHIVLSDLVQAYTGTPRMVTATTTPSVCGPAAVTYNGSSTPPTNVGSYTVVASVTNPNCVGPNVTGTLIVFAYAPGAGSFVVGDVSAASGGSQTWWGAQWWKANVLSGGSAPASFKGFADSTSSAPPQCGGSWTSDPGNSSSPPASVPAYMAVIVSSAITKSGSTVSGNVAQVVVIKTAAGYAADPGHAGTGAIVAQVCHQ